LLTALTKPRIRTVDDDSVLAARDRNLLLLPYRVDMEQLAIDDSGLYSIGNLQPRLNTRKLVEVVGNWSGCCGIRFAAK
jgi:hypothetical protein